MQTNPFYEFRSRGKAITATVYAMIGMPLACGFRPGSSPQRITRGKRLMTSLLNCPESAHTLSRRRIESSSTSSRCSPTAPSKHPPRQLFPGLQWGVVYERPEGYLYGVPISDPSVQSRDLTADGEDHESVGVTTCGTGDTRVLYLKKTSAFPSPFTWLFCS